MGNLHESFYRTCFSVGSSLLRRAWLVTTACGALGTTAELSNREVRKARVASTGIGPGLIGMVNESELLINVANENELKKLTSSSQNGTRRIFHWLNGIHGHTRRTAKRQNLNQSVIDSERGKPVTLPGVFQAKRTARNAHSVAGKGWTKKRTRLCNGGDRS